MDPDVLVVVAASWGILVQLVLHTPSSFVDGRCYRPIDRDSVKRRLEELEAR
jgi:hypothetical protein